MTREVRLSKKFRVKLKVTGGTPRSYRFKFNRDIFQDFALIQKTIQANQEEDSESFPPEFFTIMERLVYIMAKDAMPEKISDDIEVWLKKLPAPSSIYTLMQEAMKLWKGNQVQTSENNKKKQKMMKK